MRILSLVEAVNSRFSDMVTYREKRERENIFRSCLIRLVFRFSPRHQHLTEYPIASSLGPCDT
jgi:hypothetical protein